ncbi:phosphatase PAP2 family protein [Novosphingobium sp. G106]|uniref:phosphatase PAP2 family protein n=1 Tax=Novosphingobium sp. G106 TaxID=2849500 RepID=UPI001C2D81BE|nr:phosphatase PAP2 family protein [Novosphingobium sp. G106]MBV1686930.1 phosphatase PAP2 family protein [Novosphingobium sp. G106]
MTDSTDHRPAETVVLLARGWRIDPRHALIAALLCLTGFAVVAGLVVTGRSEAFDTAGLKLWREGVGLAVPHGPAWLEEAVRDYTALGGTLLRNLFALGAIVSLLFLKLRREAVLLAATVISGWIFEAVLKGLFDRPRPTIVPHLMDAGGSSFPSGHSFNGAVVYIAMALAFAAISRRRAVRWTVIGVALSLTLLVSLSRVWLGVHYPSDAIAGWLGGAGWAFLASAVLYAPAKAVADQSRT